MIFSEDRETLRKMYVDAWQKQQSGAVMTPLETQIAAIVNEHPEYHEALQAEKLAEDFSPERGETNPFLHMGLHMAVREQLATDRPAGVREQFEKLAARLGEAHAAEHRMIDALAETLWEAQRNQQPPDERHYLERLKSM